MKTLGQLDNGTFFFYNQGLTSPQAGLSKLDCPACEVTSAAGQWNLLSLQPRPDFLTSIVQLVGETRTAGQWNLRSLQPGFTLPHAGLSSLWGDKVSWTMKPSLCTTRGSTHHRPNCPAYGETRTAGQWNLRSLQPRLHFTTGRTFRSGLPST